MNYTYFGNRIKRSSLGNLGLQLLESQEKLVSQEFPIGEDIVHEDHVLLGELEENLDELGVGHVW